MEIYALNSSFWAQFITVTAPGRFLRCETGTLSMKIRLETGEKAKYRVLWERKGERRSRCVPYIKSALFLAVAWAFEQKYRHRDTPKVFKNMPVRDYYMWVRHRFMRMYEEKE